MDIKSCPGAANIKGTPTLEEKVCPVCGSVIELFSNEMSTRCGCGFVAYNEIQSCVSWCNFARECVGEDAYEQIRTRKSVQSLP